MPRSRCDRREDSPAMKYKVKIVEATNPLELEKRVAAVLEEPELRGYELMDVKTTTTMMPGAKVSRGGIFYLSTLLLKRV